MKIHKIPKRKPDNFLFINKGNKGIYCADVWQLKTHWVAQLKLKNKETLIVSIGGSFNDLLTSPKLEEHTVHAFEVGVFDKFVKSVSEKYINNFIRI